MATEKLIYELDAHSSTADSDVLPISATASWDAEKITISDLKTAVDAWVTSVNSETWAVTLTTGNISEDTDKNYVTDAQKVVIWNTSGTNTGDQDLSSLATKANVLELDNTTPFTPDADYEPATKKYVDDNGWGWWWQVDSVVAWTGINVDSTDPVNPIVSVTWWWGWVDYGNTIIVAKSGWDYDTIQAAINASTNWDTILIYDGVYEEEVTTKAGWTTSLVGMGTMGAVVIQSDTSTCLTVPSTMMSMAFIKNLKLKSESTGSNPSKLFVGNGMMTTFNSITFDYEINDWYAEKMIDLQSGSYNFFWCRFDFDWTGTSWWPNNFIYTSWTSSFNLMQSFWTMSLDDTASTDRLRFAYDISSWHNIIKNIDMTIEATSASYAWWVGFYMSENSNEIELMNNKVVLTTPSWIWSMWANFLHLNWTGWWVVHTTWNRVSVTWFTENKFSNINTTETLYSHFDDIVAEDWVTWDGTYSYVNSPSNGNLRMSGNIIKKLIEVTADYDETESWEFWVMNATPSTGDITATVNPTVFGNAETGNSRTFINSGTEYNLIFDPNGWTVWGSTQARAIYPWGYLIIEKVGDEAIVVASHNTSFNISLDDISNKSFHIDFSDASSITTSWNSITNVVDSINSWNWTSTLAGNVKYWLSTQNWLNTALWNENNSTINFGDRDIHSNTANRWLTIIAVIKPTYGWDAIISKYADNTPNREWKFLTNSSTIYEKLDGSGNEATLNYSSNYTEWEVLEISRVPWNRLYVYKNGYLLGSSSYVTNDIPNGTADLMVGIGDISWMDYLGEMWEILALSDTITSDERAALTSKLWAKRGIDVAAFSSSDSSPFWRDDETDTIKPLIDNDNLDMGSGTIKSTAVPANDEDMVNKKYFDDNSGWWGLRTIYRNYTKIYSIW